VQPSPASFVATLFLAWLPLSTLTCDGRSGGARDLTREVPGLDREFAAHLVSDDDSTFARFCMHQGWNRVYHVVQRVGEVRDTSSLEAFARQDRLLRPHALRLAQVLGSAFDLHELSRARFGALSAPPEAVLRRMRLAHRVQQLRRNTGPDLEATDRELREMLAGLDPGDPEMQARVLAARAAVAIERGDPETQLACQRAAVERMGLVGGPNYCQELGVLAETLHQSGRPDSMAIVCQRGLDHALRHRIDDHTARFSTFLANHYASSGRWALASEYFREARRVARGLSESGVRQVRLLETLEFATRLGCWTLVRQELRMAESELRRAAASRSPWTGVVRARFFEFRALEAVRNHDLAEAERWFVRAEEPYRAVGARAPAYVRVLTRRAGALLDAGRTRLAIAVAQRALEQCDRFTIPEHAPKSALMLARARLAAGDPAGCRKALARFESKDPRVFRPTPSDWIDYDAVRARLLKSQGDPRGAAAALESGLARLESTLAATDRSSESRLFRAGHRELRQLLHDWTTDDAAAGLEIERLWRSTVLVAAEPGDLRRGMGPILRRLDHRPTTRPAIGDGPPDDSTGRLVYFFGDRVVRWTRTRSAMRREELPVAPADLERRIERIRASLISAEVATGDETRLATELGALAAVILPMDLLAHSTAPGRSLARLEIFTDGPLARLPFEVLNVGRSGYHPLIERCRIAYVRGVGNPSPPAGDRERGPGLLIADPALSPAIDRAHGGLASLPMSRLEAATLLDRDASAALLVGDSATKRAVVSRWERARYLWFATHVLNNGESPYVSFIPLARDSSEGLAEREFLEATDVLDADLSACELVVLSGCSSGVLEPGAGEGGVGLAAAFLDAGARAAVRTFWPVRDDDAADLMGRFIRRWRADGARGEAGFGAERALHAARIERLRAGRGLADASAWAAFAIELARPTGERAGLPLVAQRPSAPHGLAAGRR